MLSRPEISISRRMPVAPSNRAFFLQPVLCALIIFGLTAFGSITVASAQEPAQPQTQPSPSPAALPPADQAPSAPVPPKAVALYNLLQKKS
ncbi:MAG: hypothetical protein WBQ19_17255, partial [Terriglobales bacterium]